MVDESSIRQRYSYVVHLTRLYNSTMIFLFIATPLSWNDSSRNDAMTVLIFLLLLFGSLLEMGLRNDEEVFAKAQMTHRIIMLLCLSPIRIFLHSVIGSTTLLVTKGLVFSIALMHVSCSARKVQGKKQ